ncbi:MAG TPA: hypothetical protein VH641_15485 [Streptosporangiaceae bacterium]|jgi:hypothetical protein
MNGVLSLVLGIAVLGLVIYRQLRVRPVRANLRIMVILAIIGVVETAQYLRGVHHDSGTIAAELAGSLVLALLFGVARAFTVRLSFRDGQWWAQGNWLTVVLWVLAVAAHLGYDYLVSGGGSKAAAFGNATLLLYLAITFGAQRLIVQARAQRLGVGGPMTPPLAP